MSPLQSDIATFIHDNALTCDPATRALDLASEFGEVVKEILKSSDYGKRSVAVTDDMKEELGDLAFSLYALAVELDVDLEAATHAGLRKYQTRLSASGSAGSGR